MEPNHTFSTKLNSLRKARNLTVQELAKLAGVSQPLISNLLHGQRVIGEYTARKIAAALQLQGEDLESFVYSAINNCTEKVLSSSKAYPAEILNMVAGQLYNLGILPQKIKGCIRNGDRANTALHLEDGRSAYINLEVAFG